jgi:hypothetical protein
MSCMSRSDKISNTKLLKQYRTDVTLESIGRERRLRMAHRTETMGWDRLPKRVLYSTLVVDASSTELARKKGWSSNLKANIWTDLQRFDLAGDNKAKLSVNCAGRQVRPAEVEDSISIRTRTKGVSRQSRRRPGHIIWTDSG